MAWQVGHLLVLLCCVFLIRGSLLFCFVCGRLYRFIVRLMRLIIVDFYFYLLMLTLVVWVNIGVFVVLHFADVDFGCLWV